MKFFMKSENYRDIFFSWKKYNQYFSLKVRIKTNQNLLKSKQNLKLCKKIPEKKKQL